MCKSKAAGGKRCRSHIYANYNNKLEWKERWEETLDQRWAKILRFTEVRNWKTLTEEERETYKAKAYAHDRRNLINAENNVAKFTQLVEEAELEKMNYELTLQKRTRKSGKKQFLGVDLKQEEWDYLTQVAIDRGYSSRSELVRELLNGLPVIRPFLAGTESVQHWDGTNTWGRQPTTGRKGNYYREAHGVRVTEDELQRLEREAGLFGLTRSDYVRALVMGRDPRTFGYHISTIRREESLNVIAKAEQIAGVTEQNVQQYWAEAIRKEREEPQAA